jgi:hypothetical protein
MDRKLFLFPLIRKLERRTIRFSQSNDFDEKIRAKLIILYEKALKRANDRYARYNAKLCSGDEHLMKTPRSQRQLHNKYNTKEQYAHDMVSRIKNYGLIIKTVGIYRIDNDNYTVFHVHGNTFIIKKPNGRIDDITIDHNNSIDQILKDKFT